MLDRRRMLIISLLLALFLTVPVLPAAAQTQDAVRADRLSEVVVEIWPDFDDPSVLVLFTGTLPPASLLPANVRLPLPADARINAVARIDETSGSMFEDLQYQRVGDEITITVTSSTFRFEYYYPYAGTGLERQFAYEGPAGLAVDNLVVSVQQPAVATSMTTEPAGTDETTDSLGLRYVNFQRAQAVGDPPLAVEVSYTMASATLTASTLEPAGGAAPVPTTSTTDAEGGTNWPLIVLGGLGLLVSGLFLGSGLRDWRRSQRRGTAPRRGKAQVKPKPRRAEPPARRRAASAVPPSSPPPPPPVEAAARASTPGARFCHQCGTPSASADDRFCRSCGTELRRP